MGRDGIHIAVALSRFTTWLCKRGPDVRIWGNGADFDNVVLTMAYARAGHNVPWKFWNNRCYRTLKAQRPDIRFERTGTHHNALHDAESQARHLIVILRSRGADATASSGTADE